MTINYKFYTILDIDECALGIDQCAHMCHNTNGSYICSCNAGYLLNSDLFNCDAEEGVVSSSAYHGEVAIAGILLLITVLSVVGGVLAWKVYTSWQQGRRNQPPPPQPLPPQNEPPPRQNVPPGDNEQQLHGDEQ